MIPGPSNSLNMETAATLERRRETLIKKAKEYHKELESLLVSSFVHFIVFSLLMFSHSPFALFNFMISISNPIYIFNLKDRRTSTSIYNSQPTFRTERKKSNHRTRTKRKTRKDQSIPRPTTCKHYYCFRIKSL